MPIYEYQCAECGRSFEAFLKINDPPLTGCRFCTGKVEQLVSRTSFQLKGDGWYVTDYAKKSDSPATDAPKSDSAEKPSGGKSDSAAKSSENSSSGKKSAD